LKIEVFLLRSQKNTEKVIKKYEFSGFIFEPENYLIKNETSKTTLTEREAQLLKLFLDNPNTVLKREKILMELWGSDDYFLGRSLDVFISRLRKIIKETPTLAIENIPRVGFKWVSEK
jgi:DNA-binding response OmpR family regulator